MTATGEDDKREARDDEAQLGNEKGKENEEEAAKFCFGCKSSLVKSPELIHITGQSGRRWHPECFKCFACQEPMDKRPSCHVYKDQILCRSDYLRLKRDQSTKCMRCQWPIGSSDWVRRAADCVYHIACFNCDICFRQLNTGEQFVINKEPLETGGELVVNDCVAGKTVRLMCKLHFTVENSAGQHRSGQQISEQSAQEESTADAENLSLDANKTSKQEHRSSIKAQCKQRQRVEAPEAERMHLLTASGASCSSSLIRSDQQASSTSQSQRQPASSLDSHNIVNKEFSLTASSPTSCSLMNDDNFVSRHHRIASSGSTSSSTTSTSSTMNGASMTPASGANGLQSKSKRVRTTFTEDQLSILQTHFQIDSNPDGQDLERIATITGLSKRVTQVWFQNSRARQKKYMIKRKPNQHGAVSSLAGLNITHQHNIGHPTMTLVGHSPTQVSPTPNPELGSSDGQSGILNQHQEVYNNFQRQFRDTPPLVQVGSQSDSRSATHEASRKTFSSLEMDTQSDDEGSLRLASDDDAEQELGSSKERCDSASSSISNLVKPDD